MIKRFPKGFGMKIIFGYLDLLRNISNFFGCGEDDFGNISTVSTKRVLLDRGHQKI
jgi:hypothetical protein